LILDLGPVPVEVAWSLLILHLEKPSLLEVHERYHLLVPIVHHEGTAEVVELSFLSTALRGREDAHSPEDLDLVVLLHHLSFDLLGDLLEVISHNTLAFNAVDLKVVIVPLALRNAEGQIDMTGSHLLGLDHVHVLQLLDELVQLLNSFLIFILHHPLNIGDLLVEVRAGHVEVLVADLMEHRILAG